MMARRRIASGIAVLSLAACATTPTGREQLVLVPEDRMDELGSRSFRDIRQKQATADSPHLNRYVQCVAQNILGVLEDNDEDWNVVVFDEPSINAFALPDGSIGIHKGMLDVANTPAQLAAVIGHEVAHVQAQHAAERVSQELTVSGGLAALGLMLEDRQQRKTLTGLLGAGASVGILLPYSRTHESEADQIGLNLMARAGYDPRKAVTLWREMAKKGGQRPPEFLSTHPEPSNRIEHMRDHMDNAMQLYTAARRAGRHPSCTPPSEEGETTARQEAGHRRPPVAS